MRAVPGRPERPPRIRRAVPADARALARLRYEFRSEIAPPVEAKARFVARCARWMSARLRRGGAWRCWVVEDPAGDLIGAAWLQLIEKLPNPVAETERHAYITNVYVRPSHRGQGIGGRLLAALLAEGDREAVDAVILWPTPRSRSLYERHGFAVRDDLLERR
jgi:GNAT superfamily N-acetyltransferase